MYYIGVDLGTSAVKLLLMEESGKICNIVSKEYPLFFPHPGLSLIHIYREMAEELGMDALVEAHDAEEVERALKSGARIIGVNNRDLRTFEVDMANSINLRKLAPENVIFVSESGIRTSEDIQRLHDNKIEAVLVGETPVSYTHLDVYKRQT